ncbi:MAG: nucleotidyltransferase family protein [Patescibacteria group bacterium]
MIYTAVILAAGKGTRMKELSAEQPKHVIPVAQRPFLFYLLDNLTKAGFTKLIVVVGYQKEEMIKRLKEWQGPPLEIVNQARFVPADRYGTLCPVQAVEHLLKNKSFVVVSGDNLYSTDDLKVMGEVESFNYIAGLPHSNSERYGVLVEGQEGFLQQIIEKPKDFVGNLINTGLYTFTPEVFKVMPQVKISSRGEYELTDAVTILARQGRVKIKKLKDYWLDFTKPEDVVIVDQFIKAGKL